MSDKLELAALFQRKVKELRAKDQEQAKILGGEILEYASAVMAVRTGLPTVWDVLYPQIKSISGRQRISEEQVIHDLFATGTAESFMLLLQLG
ncbi:hypothetical protein A3J33_00485 [candidate division WWE3 bacterium RIFCSPLOWO2_02_FULL_53_10]|uniref:Uncharacterized protein n=1 Tax=candidate division WWE3 bacterium RIFCSPLOWO2_02_FULL_53_10 TaxID=1802629 RepID=A0A1F4WFY3_UNCKA|nr:MAG: hypothetical protein A3J33_00485 [candidate division WWE3 bacterium RIFCSPLOWO2_02_FULL_53_10]